MRKAVRGRMRKMKNIVCFVFLLLAGSSVVSAQYTNMSDVLDGSGVTSSGGGYTNISASGQPGGISQSMAGTLPLNSGTIVNQAGFLNTFLLHPNQLSVHGIPVEIDPDNDGDGLSDIQEITGSAFTPATPTDPNNPSTSGNGVSDSQAAAAGVNPLDPNAAFKIISVTNASGQVFVTWRAHGNSERKYVVNTTTNALQPYGTAIFSNYVAGGSYPWYVVTNTIPDSSVTNAHFFSISVSQ